MLVPMRILAGEFPHPVTVLIVLHVLRTGDTEEEAVEEVAAEGVEEVLAVTSTTPAAERTINRCSSSSSTQGLMTPMMKIRTISGMAMFKAVIMGRILATEMMAIHIQPPLADMIVTDQENTKVR